MSDAVNVLRLCWLGIPATQYQPMIDLFRDVMGLQTEFEEETTAEFSMPSGDRVQVFAPGHPYFDFYGEHGPVALFEVDDLSAAHAELVAAGIEMISSIEQDSAWEWVNFRAPDGNVYAIGSRRSTPS